MTDPSDMEALALAAESFGRLAEAINTVTEKMADAIARNSRDIEALRDENRALSNRIEGLIQALDPEAPVQDNVARYNVLRGRS